MELERQRKIHDSLITMGLKLISDSYLDGMSRTCAESRHRGARMMDGRASRDPQGCHRLAARSGRDRRPGDRACARQRYRLRLRARRPPGRPRCLGGQARPSRRSGARHDPGRRRRQPPIVRRADDRARTGGKFDRRSKRSPSTTRICTTPSSTASSTSSPRRRRRSSDSRNRIGFTRRSSTPVSHRSINRISK